MIDIEKFVFKSNVENNPLIGTQLTAMKYFGYMIFEHQRLKRLQCFRGVVFTSTFILFNIAQVSIKMSQNIPFIHYLN
jgi:gustatory receptor